MCLESQAIVADLMDLLKRQSNEKAVHCPHEERATMREKPPDCSTRFAEGDKDQRLPNESEAMGGTAKGRFSKGHFSATTFDKYR